jgi:hypothetical protein
MKRVHRPSALRQEPHISGLFAALCVGAYALLLVDLYATDQLGRSWAVLLVGAVVVLLGSLGFPAIEHRRNRRLTAAYFAVQLPLGAAIFATSTLGGTFVLLVVVAQSVLVLPPWGTLLIGAPLPLLLAGHSFASCSSCCCLCCSPSLQVSALPPTRCGRLSMSHNQRSRHPCRHCHDPTRPSVRP